MLQLYNTLGRKKEVFKPIKKGQVGMYTCGPTVYSYQHIGNLRAYLFADFVKRVLLYNKFKVNHIINITDVGHLTADSDDGEDKMEAAANKEQKSAKEVANYYFSIFHEDLKKINVLKPSKWTKATEHIKEQIELIKSLEKKGYTYKTQDGIYFDSAKFKNYGSLAKLKIEGLQEGKRIEVGDKKNKTDFALWKFSEKPGQRQQEWQSPWGIGFPGWHIECSAMSMKYLGKHFDIHTGGEDHIPLHHTNEIAQSEAATGEKFVNYWMHGAFLTFKGEKVSKSTGGLYTLSDLENLGYPAIAFRYLCLTTHYHKPLNFSLETLDAAKNAYERLQRKIIELKKSKSKTGKDKSAEYKKEFEEAINEDVNIPQALQIVWKVIDDSDFTTVKKRKLLEMFDSVLGLGMKDMTDSKVSIPEKIKSLVQQREKARKEKRWSDADLLRKEIGNLGFTIEDSASGPIISKL